jgi:hypothetical protein
MTNTQTITTKTNHYFRALVALAALAMVAMVLTATASRTAHATTTFTVNTSQDAQDTFPGNGVCDSDGVDGPGDDTHTCTLRRVMCNELD